MFAGEAPAGRQGSDLGDAEGGFAHSAVGYQRRQELFAEGIAEEPFARGDVVVIIACIPDAE